LKSGFGMDRNFLRGLLCVAVNTLLAGATYNLKMRWRELKALIFGQFRTLERFLGETQEIVTGFSNRQVRGWIV